MTNKNKVMLVDGMALLFRAYYATAMSGYYMINSKGIPTNGIFGFTKHLLTAINKYKPSHVICCWDMGSKTYRNELYPDYKGNREEPPEELVPQFDLVKDVTEALNIPNIGVTNYEADDCIGTLAEQYKENAEVMILTGDQDILQLLDENVYVILLKKGYGNYEMYSEERFIEEKGITPKQFVDLKALMGDSSDNYPGVRGIGEKTGLNLLQRFQSIEGILNNLQSLTKAQRTKIERDLDMLHLSRKLAEIHCEIDVTCSLDEAILNIDEDKIMETLNELEIKNLTNLLKEAVS